MNCRGAIKFECPLYPQKLPRLSRAGAAALGQQRTSSLAALYGSNLQIWRRLRCKPPRAA